MLLCKQMHGVWHLVYIDWLQMMSRHVVGSKKRHPPMSKTAAFALAPSASVFARLLASIDRLLMKSAAISNRNGDLPRFGL